MDDDISIKVEHVSKKHCKSLKMSMLYGVKDILRNAFGMSSHSERLRKEEFWAVNDISFDVKKGEILGIIGPNGSGKTTILKMLNGIFWPDKGKITIKGKVSALIEIGAGFHPLLTGRENIYLNAAILGMTKKEVDKKFKDIVEFADIGDFIDTPVKFYSSGMFVRLGFSVAVHSEPDILLVDEVLSVGDMAFQRRCIDKMMEYKTQGRTIIFVSHSLHSIESICDRAIWLTEGVIRRIGETREVIACYINESLKKGGEISKGDKILSEERRGTQEIKIIGVKLLDIMGNETDTFKVGDKLKIQINYQTFKRISRPHFSISLWSEDGIKVNTAYTDSCNYSPPFVESMGIAECIFDSLPLLPRRYFIRVAIIDSLGRYYDLLDKAATFVIEVTDIYGSGTIVDGSWGMVHLPATWNFYPGV